MSQRWDLNSDFKRQAFNAHISQLILAGKKPVVQFITNQDNPKTPSQIAYSHSLIHALADHLNRDFEEVKTDSKREFGVIKVSTSTITGDRTARLSSFADYTRDEMIGFITALEAHLLEHGVRFQPAKM
jgi:hypothetical protein